MKLQANGSPLTNSQVQLLQSRRFLMTDLFTFQPTNNVSDFFTNLDVPVNANGNLFKANSIRIDSFRYKLDVGTNVDEQTIKVYTFPGDQLSGAEFMTSLLDGALDGGYVIRDRAFWDVDTGVPSIDFGEPPDLVVRLSNMRVSTVIKAGRGSAEIKLKSPLVLLNINMPRNYYQPSCLWTLYDTGCTIVKGAWGFVGQVAASPAPAPLKVAWNGGIPNPTGGDGWPMYSQGRCLFLTGPASGVQVGVATNDGTTLYFTQPLDVPPVAGDAFEAFAGCSKTLATCTNKFGNAANWRGYDQVPPVFISL